MESLTPQEILSYIGAFIVGLVYVALLWKYLRWGKTLIMILVCFAVDTDHFLLSSQGFREHPIDNQIIMHAFHTIEFALLVIVLNLIIGIHTLKKGWKTWLIPQNNDYSTPWQFYLAWIMRIILLGVFLHFAQDIPIYAIQWKWSYYDYSLIHYYCFW